MTDRIAIALLFVVMLAPLPSSAHHSVAATFDVGQILDIEGTVTAIRWQNPHVRFEVSARDGAVWEIETNSVSILRRMNISNDVLRVGEAVRVAGNPARNGGDEIYARNILLPGTAEVLLSPGSRARWDGETIGSSDTWLAAAGDTSAPERGIFRVWSTSLASGLGFWRPPYPLTASAEAARARFDPVSDSPILNCAPKGMPAIMEQPYPMEFVDDGTTIRLRLEEYDTVRSIRLDADPADASEPLSNLGYSVGRWEGRTLVVTTTRVGWGVFNHSEGIPLSSAARMVERFTPSEDGSRLDYAMTVTDAATFTRPVELGKSWIWLPEVRVEPYDCTN